MSTEYWKQLTPFYFYTAAVSALGVAAATSETRPLAGILRLFVCGFLSWALVEYGLHRFVFHYSARMLASEVSFSAAHQSHHDRPQAVDQLFSSLKMSVPVALCYWLLAWAVSGSWQTAVYLFVGLVAGYFSYELLHYQAHHGTPRLRPFKYLRKYHLLHHHQTPDLRFGVTSPVIDYLFGTFRPVGREARRSPK